jgi:DNA-binding transcriptional MocR family regulator
VAALLRDQDEEIVTWRGHWLRSRHDALVGALRARLPDWTWPEPDGGLSLWVRLPGAIDGGAFAQAALRHGVAVVPSRLLSVTSGVAAGQSGPDGEVNSCVRLAFIQPPDLLRTAVAAVAAIPGAAVGGPGPRARRRLIPRGQLGHRRSASAWPAGRCGRCASWRRSGRGCGGGCG